MYVDVINAQQQNIENINIQEHDDDDINKKLDRHRKIIEIFVPKIERLEQFATANGIAPVRGYTDSDTNNDF